VIKEVGSLGRGHRFARPEQPWSHHPRYPLRTTEETHLDHMAQMPKYSR